MRIAPRERNKDDNFKHMIYMLKVECWNMEMTRVVNKTLETVGIYEILGTLYLSRQFNSL